MLLIKSPSIDPYFNIASEEYLLKDFSHDIFLLYINEPSIVVGKHQNTLEEINIDYVHQNKLKVVRRLSGGGTVYHDLGNLNFAFIINGIENKLIDFKKYTLPIVSVLKELNVDARFEGRNDIRINGKKVSGNAEHIFKKRVLHHGTLLFDSDLDRLNDAIKVQEGVYKSGSVKSVRSVVANVKEYLNQDITIDQLVLKLISHIMKIYPDCSEYEFSEYDLAQINRLIQNKYASWAWNYGYSPSYVVSRSLVTGDKVYFVETKVINGKIVDINIKDTSGNNTIGQDLLILLIGEKHNMDTLAIKLKSEKNQNYFPGLTLENLFTVLF